MNTSVPRLRRKHPEREAPTRNRFAAQPKAHDAAAGEPDRPPQETPESSGGPLLEALECGVRTAYTVIDEYMRRGYEAAGNGKDRPGSQGYMRDDKPNYNNWPNPFGNPFGPMGSPMQQPVQQWLAAMKAWTDAWSAFVPGAQQMWNSASGMAGNAAPYTGPYQGAHSTPPAISVQVSSSRPTGVTVTLNPGADCGSLSVGWLMGEISSPPLQGVSITSAQGILRVSVPVTAEQPAGTYSAEIVSANGKSAGKMSVVIAGEYGKPA